MMSYFASTNGRYNVLLTVHRPHGNAISFAVTAAGPLFVINGIHTRLFFGDDVGLIHRRLIVSFDVILDKVKSTVVMELNKVTSVSEGIGVKEKWSR